MKRLLLKAHLRIIDVIRKWGQPLRGPAPLVLTFVVLSVLQISCESRRAVSGVLVIGVEGLKPDDIPCEAVTESDFRGFNFLCHEFLRLQGTVANSTSSAANLASLLTSLPPDRHGLRTNDGFVSSEMVLLSEKLSSRGWKAGLISASPPISRRTNLSQGFESFDEANNLAPKIPYRSFEQTAGTAMSWLTGPDLKRFFLFLSASDLVFPEYTAVSDKGEDRPRSVEGQIEEFDESLFHFFEDLKRRKLWDRMWIVVVGLSGRADGQEASLPGALRLSPAQMQVPVFIKGRGADMTTDSPLKGVWSHVQIGQFLEELVGETEHRPDGNWTEARQALLDHSVPYVGTEGCVRGDDGPICRQAFFDQTAWLTWESPLRLESPGRRELMLKIKNEFKDPPPRALGNMVAPKLALPPWRECLESFEDDSLSANRNACPSKPAQILRNLVLIRKSVEGRPESLKDERLRFLHDYNQLRAAAALYQKYAPTRLFADLHTRPVEELRTLDKILERPDLADIRREAARTKELKAN